MMQTIIIKITDKCCNKCSGCYAYKSKNEMSIKDFEKVMKKLPVPTTLTLTGGEPLMHHKIEELCKIAKDKLQKPVIMTSGAVKFNLNNIKSSIRGLIITLKYPLQMIDNLFKQNQKAFQNAVSLMKQASRLNIPFDINFCIDGHNYMYLEKVRMLARNLGARRVNILKYLVYYPEEVARAISPDLWNLICKQASKMKGINIAFMNKFTGYRCGAGFSRVYIMTNGDYTPCLYDEKTIIGNIFKESYDNVQSKLLEWRKNTVYNTKSCYIEKRLGGWYEK